LENIVIKGASALKLNSIDEEAAACRKAFKNVKVGALVWHCHHEQLIEPLTKLAENRIAFILRSKSQHEQALRLHLFRPFKGKIPSKLKKIIADWEKADADWEKAKANLWQAKANWEKVDADRQKADADWEKVKVDSRKAIADWQKAKADWWKAKADWWKADADATHKRQCKNCPWDGRTIFPQGERP
jgi:hypothetical protein